MNIELFMFIGKVSAASTLAPFFLGLVKFRSISTELKLLLTLTGVSFASDMAALYHTELKANINYVSDVYTMLEFILLMIIYYRALNNPKLYMVFLTLSLFYVLFLMSNVIFFQQENINSYTDIFSALIFIVLAVLFFYKLMKDLPTLQVYRLPMFWINVAVLLYFSGNLFLWIVSNYLVTVLNDNLMIYWSFHNFLNILKNILFAVGFYVSFRPPQNSL